MTESPVFAGAKNDAFANRNGSLTFPPMENAERKIRHDIRGTFHALVLSTEVLHGVLPPEERDIFLSHVVEACDRIDDLIGQFLGAENAVEA